jgi:hypothetical protein
VAFKTVNMSARTALHWYGRRGQLALVAPRNTGLPSQNLHRETPSFSPAEKRHNFAIWVLKDEPASRRRLYLYYCVRCNWAFSVDGRGLVIPLNSNGGRIEGEDGSERLATFATGPCPSFTRLIPGRRFTQTVTPIRPFAGRLAAMISASRQIWHAAVWRLLHS